MKAEDIFHEALKAKSAEERKAYLDAACQGDAALRSHIESLLAHDEKAQGFLETLFLGSDDPLSEKPGSMIGPYKLLQQIGEGGFGVVYMAEQAEPVRRTVALKVIKVGMDTREVVTRFEAERQALAMMEHPNIARVLDAGATLTGRPYFVMELVRGMPLTEYCDTNHLSPRERLELFTQVCNAIQHAHQKGVIHRDIKPSNILVTLHDGVPVPKVIDFGIAKALNARLTERTLFTRFGQVVGTPLYMSPEQAAMSGLDVDTCSDIYSLGVLLYELLTGTTPIEAETLREAGYAEMQRIIREIEPPTPSTRVNRMKDKLASVAAQRRMEPARLSAFIRGDLDWIVMKCLEKDRTRRYEAASGLAADIRRHLAGEAVLAAPPSRAYRLRKLVRRNRGPVLGVGAVGLALVLGIVGTTWGMLHASARRKDAEEAQQAEGRQREATARALRRVERILAFVVKTLQASDPHRSGSQDMLVGDAMRGAIAEIDAGELRDDPETEAELCATIAGILNGNGRSADALPLAERALRIQETLHPEGSQSVAMALNLLATVHSFLGEYEKADAGHQRALDMTRKLASIDERWLVTCLYELASSKRILARFDESEQLCLQALEIGRRIFAGDARIVAQLRAELATVRVDLGKPAEAESLYREAMAMFERLFPGDHPETADTMAGLARVLRIQGRPAEAEPLARQVLEMRGRLFQGDSPYAAMALCDLGMALVPLGRMAEAEPLYVKALEMRRRMYRGDHADTGRNLNLLAELYVRSKNPAKAEPLFQESLDMHRRLRQADHVDFVRSMNGLGQAQGLQGKYPAAESTLQQAVEMCRRIYKEKPNPDLAVVLHHLAEMMLVQGRPEEALAPAREAFALYRDHPDWAPWEDAHAVSVLVQALTASGNPGVEAVEACRHMVALQRKGYASSGFTLSSSLAHLGALLLKLDTLEATREAEAALRECVEIRVKENTAGFRLGNARSSLGRAMVSVAAKDASLDPAARRSKLEEAEKMLLEGWKDLESDPQTPTVKQNMGLDLRGNALERLVTLYSEWDRIEPGKGHGGKAAEWQGKLSAHREAAAAPPPAE